jgi:hypothetical protein
LGIEKLLVCKEKIPFCFTGEWKGGQTSDFNYLMSGDLIGKIIKEAPYPFPYPPAQIFLTNDPTAYLLAVSADIHR